MNRNVMMALVLSAIATTPAVSSAETVTTPTTQPAAAATTQSVGASVVAAPVGQVVATPIATPTIAATQVQVVPGQSLTLPANTELVLRLSETVNSKQVKEGAKFRVALAQDVMVGNYVVLPKGTPGRGEVTYRSGKGAFGKSAKMEITMRSLDLPTGRSIPLEGMTRQEGQGNTGATVGTAVAVGPFAAFVTGRSAVFQEGREVRGFTREALQVDIPK